MRALPVLLVLLLCSSRSLSAADAVEASVDGPVVLLTAFKPFDNRGVNGSETVAEALRTGQPGVQLTIVVLDVAWGAPAAKLPALVKQLRPRLLIGLGEGHPGRVCVERVARNQCVGPDVFGKAPTEHFVEAGGPPQRLATLLFDPAWQLSGEIAVTTSDDAGTYLCNALLYTALGLDVPRIGFVHLPPQGDVDDKVYSDRLAPIVRELIKRNL